MKTLPFVIQSNKQDINQFLIKIFCSDDDKYVKTVRREWTNLCESLGFAPVPAYWADFG